jgi:hypothetical protein
MSVTRSKKSVHSQYFISFGKFYSLFENPFTRIVFPTAYRDACFVRYFITIDLTRPAGSEMDDYLY